MFPDCHGLDAHLILSIVLGGTSALLAFRVWGAVIFWEADVRERNGKRQEATTLMQFAR